MLSLRRYSLYLGVAACFVILLSYYREPLLSGTINPFRTNSASSSNLADPDFRWSDVPVRNRVKKYARLPTAPPKQLPKVQFDFASRQETSAQLAQRRERQAAVKKTFERCWRAYCQHAWGHDELTPISGGYRDSFGGWAANAVDNLDNLYLMGKKSEFEDAVKLVIEIDLTQCALEQINVFETTIRHLGGLLSAYDLSGDERLLKKAKEFGDMLIVAFDTPNRMPITRWHWSEALRGRQVADSHVLVAEIGSLSMEFTRLTMLTGEPKWYDAVERIYQVFEKQQQMTFLPGMWPVTVNARTADFTGDTLFTLSAMADSLYEYFPKMHALLGGTDPRYKKLYDGSMKTAIEYNLWRPMVPDNADILLSGSVHRHDEFSIPELDSQGQHLMCFAGGMFALGGKLFDEPAHVDIGKKITDGCIWAYNSMPLSIMPEVFRMVSCSDRVACEWNETLWQEGVRKEYGDAIADEGEAADIHTTIASARLPPGFTQLVDRRYILRPEAIESVFILYRITGDRQYMDTAWEMFNAIVRATETKFANAALSDISFTMEDIERGEEIQEDSMESFWMAETLKYFYLVFGDTEVLSLDEWVFNTEAHPFRRALPGRTR